MKAIEIRNPATLQSLEVVDHEIPNPGPEEICVRVRACSLNFHDYAVATGLMLVDDGRIPMSDGAGDVTAIGDNVELFRVGDKVMSTFFPQWSGGPVMASSTQGIPGDHVNGFAAEHVCMPATAFTAIPAGYSMEEAATLPCAALTAWRALFVENKIQAGDWVLTQGTGGVSVFALQFAKSVGARVIATSSSPEKLKRLEDMGADHVINYKENLEWGAEVTKLTGGRGVDEVVEVGGPGTLAQSISATRVGGHISLIGVLTGWSGEIPTFEILMKNIRISGISVGSKEHQIDMVSALESADFRPLIDSTFPLEKAADALAYLGDQKHFGKVCLSL